MISRNGIELEFHHVGIPTTEMRPGERYSALHCMYTSESECRTIRVQWHRFEPASSLDPLVRTVPHVAFKVSDLERAMAGGRLLLGPYEPIPNYRVAIIEDGGIPIELVETTLSDDELWSRAETENLLYRGR